MEALKITISGSYYNSAKEIVDYEGVTGIVPKNDEDIAKYHVMSRFAPIWINAAVGADGKKLYPARVESLRKVYVSDCEEVEADLSFYGKDIKQMTEDEVQDLAVFCDLRAVPFKQLLSGSDVRAQREAAYIAYSDKALGTDYAGELKRGEFDFSSMPPLVVAGGAIADRARKISNDDVLAVEQKAQPIGGTPKANMTLDDLRELAKKNGVKYTNATGFDTLYSRLFG